MPELKFGCSVNLVLGNGNEFGEGAVSLYTQSLVETACIRASSQARSTGAATAVWRNRDIAAGLQPASGGRCIQNRCGDFVGPECAGTKQVVSYPETCLDRSEPRTQ